jgi:hypothetical protein
MNDSKNSSNGLLVLKMGVHLTDEQTQALMGHITPTADRLGVEPMVLPPGADIELQMGSSALLERVCVALEALVKQGEPPEVSEAQIAPQALNARQPSEHEIVQALSKPSGLNTRG